MAEPQPSNVKEGADAPDVLAANAEDRRAAQALSSLDARGDDEGSKKDVDLKALNDAMNRLNTAPAKAPAEVKKEEPKKLVKIDQADVALLVDQLDISKAKATDLLRSHAANVVKAITSWVAASA